MNTTGKSLGRGTRSNTFRENVHQRDQNCVISGWQSGGDKYHWTGFHSCHIFPISYEEYWQRHNFGRCIDGYSGEENTINAIENGMLMVASVHAFFDNFEFAINPYVSVTRYLLKTKANNYLG